MSDEQLHRLVKRQLRRLNLDGFDRPATPEELLAFSLRVSRSYADSAAGRYLLERSLEISSREMQELNERLRVKNATQLALQHSRLESIIASLSDGLCVVDVDGQLNTINPPALALLESTADELQGSQILARFELRAEGHGHLTTSAEALAQVIDGATLRFEHSTLSTESERVPVSCALSPIQADSTVVGCVITFHDARPARAAEAEMQALNRALQKTTDDAIEASQAKSAFLANMSHELRTPLNAVIGYSELIDEDAEAAGQESIRHDVAKIQSAAHHLLSLINNLLDLSKVEAGKMDLNLERFELSTILKDVRTSTDPLVAKNNNTLNLEFDVAGDIVADATMLKQVLINLTANAAKFTTNGTITLRSRRVNANGRDWIQLEIQDDGIGIEPDRIPYLFERFTQADESTTRRFGGTGLGLALSQMFIELHGGEILVESAVGKGSTFIVRLPDSAMVPRTFRRTTDNAAVTSDFSATPRKTVLVIDDDPDTFELVARFLDASTYELVHAESGEVGLELADELRPDIITLDVTMGSVDGWHVLETLRANPKLRETPVIMITASTDRTRGMHLGANEFLVKPITRRSLTEAVDAAQVTGGDHLPAT